MSARSGQPERTTAMFGAPCPAHCPDCGAAPARGAVVHEPTCPIWVGVNRAMDDDREWFDRRRALGIKARERPAAPAELRELEMSYPGERYAAGQVTVTEIRPGLRSRNIQVEARHVRLGADQ